jgi:hypothetical protein
MLSGHPQIRGGINIERERDFYFGNIICEPLNRNYGIDFHRAKAAKA